MKKIVKMLNIVVPIAMRKQIIKNDVKQDVLKEACKMTENNKSVTIILPGRPATKKNSGRIVQKGKLKILLPSEAFEKYENECLWRLTRYKKYKFDMPVQMQCVYYLPDKAHYPDLVGLMQATADILEKAQILDNDRLVVSWDGTHIAPALDKFNPRA